jgi:hypothetical protein
MGISNKAKLSQMDALMVESLRALGWSNEELLHRVRQGGEALPIDESEFEFDYQLLTAYATDQLEVFDAAVQSGYTIKYNTIRGIRCWISIVFGKEPEMVLEEGSESATVELTRDEKEQLTDVLSFGWSIIGEPKASASAEATSVYRIEPIQR